MGTQSLTLAVSVLCHMPCPIPPECTELGWGSLEKAITSCAPSQLEGTSETLSGAQTVGEIDLNW